jgi:hypothetical protein
MKLYLSPTNQVYAYEDDGSQDNLIPSDYVPITQAEAEVITTAQIPASQNKATAMGLLEDTDWTQIPSVSDPALSNPYLANKLEFDQYRNAVRQYAIYPVSGGVVWPTMPTENWVSV